ncbi:MAG: hypothetical protein AB1649_22620 [Chloroflexota bacterium]
MSRLPLRVTLTVWLVLFLTAWNALRFFTALAWRDVLLEFSASPPPWVATLLGGVWTVAGCILLWGILWEKPWAGRMLIGAAAGYSAWYWIERLLWQEPRPNWLFAVILNLVLILFFLFAKRSMTREAYERKSKNPTLE